MSPKIFLFLTATLFTISCSAIMPPTSTANTNTTVQNSTNTETAQTNSNTTENVAGGAQDQNTADALIKDLYKVHAKDQGKILDGKSRTLIDKYFDKSLADLIWKDLTTHTDEVGVIDFDLFYNSQDSEIKKLVVAPAKVTGEKATVTVTFENYGKKETLNYEMVRKTDWKITDIKYAEGATLLKYFKDDAKNAAAENKDDAEGDFAGNYQVGDTTATVKPIKMGFDVKWAKGSGSMTFFFVGEGEDQFKYQSENNGQGVDTFVFDDATQKKGKFIRGSDGKEMAVRKIS